MLVIWFYHLCIVRILILFLEDLQSELNGVSESLESTVLESDQADQTTFEIIPEHKVFVLFRLIFYLFLLH